MASIGFANSAITASAMRIWRSALSAADPRATLATARAALSRKACKSSDIILPPYMNCQPFVQLWAPLYRLQWRQVVIAIPARRMQQDRLQAGHTILPSRSGRQASERPPCCHKESAVAYLLPILAAWEPVERRRQLYVSETSS